MSRSSTSTASRPWWRKTDRSGMQRSVRLDRRGDVLFGRKPVFADRFRESALHLVDLSGRQVTRKDPEHHHRRVRRLDRTTIHEAVVDLGDQARIVPGSLAGSSGRPRSEERRVGKECVSTCRSRWSPCTNKKNTNQKYQK